MEDEPAQKQDDGPEVRLSDGTFLPGDDGYQFNKKCKVQVSVEYLKKTSRKKVTFKLFSVYNHEEEDLGHQVEGYEKDGVAEAEVTLFYGDTYNEALKNDPSATCQYKFKASHSKGEKEIESEALEMPQNQQAQNSGVFKVRLSIDPAKDDADDDAYILFSTDQNTSYSKTLTVKDDKIKGDEYLDLEFSDLIDGLNYSLKILPGNKEKGYFLFEDKPYKEIV